LPQKTVYQTLENRGTHLRKLEANGPYPCHWENSWLGDGYYFWDTFIENAHWWGKEIRKFNKGYIICEAICDFNDEECLDLHGNLEQLKQFKDAYILAKKNKVIDDSSTVKNFLAKLRGEIKSFQKFTAIRINGIKSKNYNSIYSINFLFEDNKNQYLEVIPAIQICFFNKTSMSLKNYRIVFPEEYEYIEGYLA
jgi:hypothetical protein